MARLVLAIVVAIVCGWRVPAALAQAEPARLALLIGNQGYTQKVGPLRNPHSDVALLEQALTGLGFRVVVLRDAGYRDMDAAIKRHVREVHRAGRGTISFFYYSGHGVANPQLPDPGRSHRCERREDLGRGAAAERRRRYAE